MLIEFRVENHRSLRDEQALSLEATQGLEAEPDFRARVRPGHDKPLLSVVGIYGANASGKSNLLYALRFMRTAVLDSQIRWDPDEGVPRDPFAWGSHSSEPSMYEATFLLEGTRYQYGFVVDDERVCEEWLRVRSETGDETWFERDGDTIESSGPLMKGDYHWRTNSLYLSAGAQQGDERLSKVRRWFKELAIICAPGDLDFGRFLLGISVPGKRPPRWWAEALSVPDLGQIPKIVEILKMADLGITEAKLESAAGQGIPLPRLLLRHQVPEGDGWMPLEEESHGTRTLVRLAGPLLAASSGTGVLIVDELESSLHPHIAARVLRAFSQRECGGQLIFTTHDTNLLGKTVGKPLLRRDQVWLTEKDDEGATCLYPLTDIEPRENENLERGYLMGRYGAIPFLGDMPE